jgi:hypothetical protein
MKNLTENENVNADTAATAPAAKNEKTPKNADFSSITSGAAAVDFSSNLEKQINQIYPGFLTDLYKSGFVNGAKFFGIYLRHNVGEKNSPKYLFIKNAVPPKNAAAKNPAAKNGKNILTTLPKNVFPSIKNLKNAVLIITITYRGVSYRTFHLNANH